MKAVFQHTANSEIRPDEYQLGRWVGDPSVLFFLGPGCSLEDRYNSLGWARLLERVEQVKAACPNYDGVKIAAFVVSLLPEESLTVHDAVATSEPLDPIVLDFLVAIADLAMRATELYVDAVLEPAPDAVRNWSERRASIRLADFEDTLSTLDEARASGAEADMEPRLRRSGEYVLALDRATAAAAVLAGSAKTGDRNGRPRPLGRTLGERLEQLFGATQVLASLEALKRLTIDATDGVPERISLRGEDVEWLTNLLWHSLRFDLPIYPTSDELAFQLALTTGQKRPKTSAHIARPELSLATQDAGSPELVAEALSWVVDGTMSTEGLSATSRRLFTAIAQVLDEHADNWQPGFFSDSVRNARDDGARGDGDADAHEFVPVVFSTSFDQQLERTLLATLRRKQVTIFVPVLVIGSRRKNQADFRWVYAQAWASGSDQAAEKELKALTWNWVPTGSADWPVESGISVVKINGAPLYPELDGEPVSNHAGLCEPAEDRALRVRPDAILRHALVLSEFELLRNLRIESSAPESFLGVLHTQGDQARRVLFLGHPIHDWLTRVRLLTRLFEPISDTSPNAGEDQHNILFSATIEPVRASLLFWADIAPVLESLSWVEETLTERLRGDGGGWQR